MVKYNREIILKKSKKNQINNKKIKFLINNNFWMMKK